VTAIPLTLANIDAAERRARQRLADNSARIVGLERLGQERALIYKTLALTGLRLGELASLTVGQFVQEPPAGGGAYFVLGAAAEKSRRGSEIAIGAEVEADLRAWLAERLEIARREARNRGDPIPMRLPSETALFSVPSGILRIFNRDLLVAGIVKRDDRSSTVDLHALRHTFCTLLGMGESPPRVVQELMRHRDPRLTANTYTDPRRLDRWRALNSMPKFPLDDRSGDRRKRPTGTEADRLLAARLAPYPGSDGSSLAIDDTPIRVTGPGRGSPRQSVSVREGTTNNPLSSPDSGLDQVEPIGLEPTTSCMPCKRSPN
jgi:hypothetical protein